jgi:primosomal protein N'
MYLIDVIPTIKIPHTQPQILSYFFSAPLATGALVQIPLGKRKETGVVLDSHPVDEYKQEIKKADFELRHIAKVISAQPLLTSRQIELTVWLGQYYFASPGIFAKMMIPKKNQKSKIKNQNDNSKSKIKKLQKLILAPTISVTNKIAKEQPNSTVWHSELTKKQLNEAWWKIKNGEARMIVGTRSAVFLPFADLKEIVIEDETNPAHRSWDMWPHYRVHEVAKKLTEIFRAKLISKSEIPSVDFFYNSHSSLLVDGKESPAPARQSLGDGGNAGRGSDIRRRSFDLRSQNDKIVTNIIDLRAELKAGNFSIFGLALQQAVKNSLAQKGQIILFINRRGAANFVLCRDCGYTAKCPNCDSPLAHHLINRKPTLLCHRCGRQKEPPSLCPQCRSWRVKTVGVGTQKVELEAIKFFPQAKIARLDSDAAPNQKEQQKIIEAFAKKEINILIATQIIFSWLDEIKPAPPATVVLVSADTLLHLPDFNSSERTFQTITALKTLIYHSDPPVDEEESPTKDDKKNTLIIQTYNPENSVIKYAATDDWESFYQEEIEARKLLGYPPFSQIVKLTFRHRDPKKAGQEAKILAAKLSLTIAPLSGTVKLKQVMIPPPLKKEGWAKSPEGASPLFGKGFKKISLNPPFVKGENWTEISDALPAFISKEKGKYVWNIIIKFPLTQKNSLLSSEFLQSRNSLLQYVPSNWEIDIDPSDLL